MLAIRLPQSVEKRLDKLARKTGRTKTFYVRHAIEEYLQDIEDYFEAHKVLERIRTGEERVYSLDEVIEKLGFDKKDLERPIRRTRAGATRKAS